IRRDACSRDVSRAPQVPSRNRSDPERALEGATQPHIRSSHATRALASSRRPEDLEPPSHSSTLYLPRRVAIVNPITLPPHGALPRRSSHSPQPWPTRPRSSNAIRPHAQLGGAPPEGPRRLWRYASLRKYSRARIRPDAPESRCDDTQGTPRPSRNERRLTKPAPPAAGSP